jgi:hypothetical protein
MANPITVTNISGNSIVFKEIYKDNEFTLEFGETLECESVKLVFQDSRVQLQITSKLNKVFVATRTKPLGVTFTA